MTLATLGYHPMPLQFSALSRPGVVRQYNEDACHADAVVSLYLETFWEQQASPKVMQRAIVRANERLLEEQTENPVIKDMGKTVVVLCRGEGNQAWFCHVGDSPLYRMRGNDSAVHHGKKLVVDGADISDIGGQSTRPGVEIILVAEELRRVIQVVDAIWRGYEFVS